MSAAEQLRRLAGDAVDEVEPGVRDAGGAQAAEGVGRVGLAPSGRGRRAAPRRSSARRGRRARRLPPPSPRTAPSTSSGLVSTVTSACGVSCGRKSVEQPLEPVRPQQAGRPAAEVERAQAAHVVRRPLPLPLGGDAVHVLVQPAGGLRPGPPARGVHVQRHRGELAVVAPGPAERHVHVDVPHGPLERLGHRVGAQKKRLPSRSSSSTPPLASITRREATLSGFAVQARRVDAERGGERQRRGQHGRGVASPPRAPAAPRSRCCRRGAAGAASAGGGSRRPRYTSPAAHHSTVCGT